MTEILEKLSSTFMLKIEAVKWWIQYDDHHCMIYTDLNQTWGMHEEIE